MRPWLPALRLKRPSRGGKPCQRIFPPYCGIIWAPRQRSPRELYSPFSFVQSQAHCKRSHTASMGNSQSRQPVNIRREQLQCDSNGVASFSVSTSNGMPARPGYYKIRANVNINQVHVRGIMVNGQETRAEFRGVMSVPIPN